MIDAEAAERKPSKTRRRVRIGAAVTFSGADEHHEYDVDQQQQQQQQQSSAGAPATSSYSSSSSSAGAAASAAASSSSSAYRDGDLNAPSAYDAYGTAAGADGSHGGVLAGGLYAPVPLVESMTAAYDAAALDGVRGTTTPRSDTDEDNTVFTVDDMWNKWDDLDESYVHGAPRVRRGPPANYPYYDGHWAPWQDLDETGRVVARRAGGALGSGSALDSDLQSSATYTHGGGGGGGATARGATRGATALGSAADRGSGSEDDGARTATGAPPALQRRTSSSAARKPKTAAGGAPSSKPPGTAVTVPGAPPPTAGAGAAGAAVPSAPPATADGAKAKSKAKTRRKRKPKTRGKAADDSGSEGSGGGDDDASDGNGDEGNDGDGDDDGEAEMAESARPELGADALSAPQDVLELSLAYQDLGDEYQLGRVTRFLSTLRCIQRLALTDNLLSDLGGVSLPLLKVLSVARNDFTTFRLLPSAPRLEYLEASDNLIDSFQWSGKYPRLRFLYLRRNPVAFIKDYRQRARQALRSLIVLDDVPLARGRLALGDEHFVPVVAEPLDVSALRPATAAGSRPGTAAGSGDADSDAAASGGVFSRLSSCLRRRPRPHRDIEAGARGASATLAVPATSSPRTTSPRAAGSPRSPAAASSPRSSPAGAPSSPHVRPAASLDDG